jgi:hypothetical protein
VTIFGVLTAVVGLGSAAFHGSLHFSTQLLDELPMIYAASQWWYIWLTSLHRIRTSLDPTLSPHSDWALTVPFLSALASVARAFEAVGLGWFVRSRARASVAYALFWTFIHTVVGFTTVFQVHFFIMTALGVALVFEFRRHFLQTNPAAAALIKRWMIFHLGFSGVAFLCWITDNTLCPRLLTLPVYPPLHAAWHVLCGGGTYSALMAAAIGDSLTRDAVLLPLPGTAAAVHAHAKSGETGDDDLFDDLDVELTETQALTVALPASGSGGKPGRAGAGGRSPVSPGALGGSDGPPPHTLSAAGAMVRDRVRDAPVQSVTPQEEAVPLGVFGLTLPFPYRYIVGPNKQAL